MCGQQMATADGCIDHLILLRNGDVLPSPVHGEESSHVFDGDCADCGASPGGIHHPHCDSARKPDGSQILIDSMAYWNPDEDVDPREPESDFAFVAVALDTENDGYPQHYRNITAFDALEKAEAYYDGVDWCNAEEEMEIRALRIQSEVDVHV